MNPIEKYVSSRYLTEEVRVAAIEYLKSQGKLVGLDIAAESIAESYCVDWHKKIADRGIKVGELVYVFGDGRYDENKRADAARKTFCRLRDEAWPKKS